MLVFYDLGSQMKLHSGKIVDVVVTSVQVFGLFCRYDGDTDLLVLIPEISWTASFCSCKQIADVGDTITVVILRVDEPTGKVSASIKQRFKNPWNSDALDVGKTYTANVIRHVQIADRCDCGPAYLLEIVPGAFAMLCTSESIMVPGDTCDVTITKSNPDAKAITIRANAR